MNHPMYDFTQHTPSPVTQNNHLERHASWLGYAGLIPFVTLAALALVSNGDLQLQSRGALIGYGAVIISFLGAWHWYAAIERGGDSASLSRMVFAVSPALLGWAALLLPHAYGMALVLTGLLITCVVDGRWMSGSPTWYRLLRRRLTVVATISMTSAVFSLL